VVIELLRPFSRSRLVPEIALVRYVALAWLRVLFTRAGARTRLTVLFLRAFPTILASALFASTFAGFAASVTGCAAALLLLVALLELISLLAHVLLLPMTTMRSSLPQIEETNRARR
jgi:hypothetical protein